MNEALPIVEMRGISIEFPGVKALDGVDFRLFQGCLLYTSPSPRD